MTAGVSTGICVFDGVLKNPISYRQQALELKYESVDTGAEVFHGIADPGDMKGILPKEITLRLSGLTSTITFFRKSPYEQGEPHFVHCDNGMGQWTGILYLTLEPPATDGTTFWRHRETNQIEASPSWDGRQEWGDTHKWEPWNHVRAEFNRLLVFPSSYFHSRAIFANYGHGENSRLVQVVFGQGKINS